MEKISKALETRRCNAIVRIASEIGLLAYYATEHTVRLTEGDHRLIGYVEPVYPRPNAVTPSSWTFDGRTHGSLGEAVDALRVFNAGRMFPPDCYDTLFNEEYRMGRMVDFYMTEVLKFDDDVDYINFDPEVSCYALKNMYGATLYRVSVSLKRHNITYSIGSGKWIEHSFDGIDDFMSKVCGLIEPSLLVDVANSLSMVEHMDGVRRDYNVDLANIDITSMSISRRKILESTRDALRKALDEIEALIEKK